MSSLESIRNYVCLTAEIGTAGQPRPDQVKQFCDLLTAQQGRKLFVHCIMNYRVSVFMFHYLCLVQGYTPQQARSPIFDTWEPEPQWQAIMELDAAALGFSSN